MFKPPSRPYQALLQDGRVVAWGSPSHGGAPWPCCDCAVAALCPARKLTRSRSIPPRKQDVFRTGKHCKSQCKAVSKHCDRVLVSGPNREQSKM